MDDRPEKSNSFRLLSLFGKKEEKRDQEEAFEEEIISKVTEGHIQGVLSGSEAEMIRNIFEFGDKDAKDIMVHRTNIAAIDGETLFSDALHFIVDSSFSRFPVYLNDLDNIIGIVHIKDVLKYLVDAGDVSLKVRDMDSIIQRVKFVPETHSINTLFAQMQQHKNHMVIVQDEYGQTSGIISMEDILEEIVGNIQDEHDNELSPVSAVTKDHFRMEGRTTLEEASELLGIDFSEEESETLNGFLIARLGRMPKEHEQFAIRACGYEFKVLDVKSMVIRNIDVTKLSQE